MSALDRILTRFRNAAVTEREKGTYFERLVLAYLGNDPIQSEQYSQIWTYADWAKEMGWTGKDTGIDLVAKMRDEDGYAAIQCKFYAADHRIQKKDVDSFLSASSRSPFRRRLFIDTTEVDWSSNADETIANQIIPVVRIGLTALRESAIDWAIFEATEEVKLRNKKTLLPHQQQALDTVREKFGEYDRGKLIMACGTGKTFTALKIAESIAGNGKRVLFLVPSLALISQTVREWTNDSELHLRSFAVCSDAQVGKRRKSSNDVAEIDAHELDFPATTNARRLAQKSSAQDAERMTVVFSTYQSIPVLTEAQKEGMPAFDLIICDEAHRTTGAKIGGDEDSNFIRVHDNKYVNGAKRLYMTATPRIYGENARAKAADASVELCDMDDESLYGPTFFTRGFSWAVENGMLTDYKVVVLAMDEAVVSRTVQSRLAADNELKLDDATKIIGCYKALLKQGREDEFSVDAMPMKRAIAFCKDIRSSKLIEREFGAVINEFNESVAEESGEEADQVTCDVRHVDGTFNAKTRGELLHWLSDDVDSDGCKILSNARCLSEGVDVPALDAIMFLHPRKSQIDVVQSVGRVMRRAEGKKLGYVILPVVIPANVSPDEALDQNERYRVVWQILNALRAHDDRFDATINKLELTNDTGGQIEVVAVADNLPQQKQESGKGLGIGDGGAGDYNDRNDRGRTDEQISFIFDEFPAAIRAKIVQKCGRRTYWEDWAKDIGKIAQQHIQRITATLETGKQERQLFDAFLAEIRDDLNGSVTEDEAVEMLAQHLITKPVFDALFEDYNFAEQNPVSKAMQKVVSALEEQNISKEAETLEGFYASVRRRASGINTADGKQKIVVELYEKFFKTAFPKMTDKLGIVYTPVEVVDFIIHSVNDILQQEFGQTLGSKGVHIIDPFTGTGTFITRLLQSGLIDKEQLAHKYKNEIHANEIVLLAYYIAAVNIEATYHAINEAEYTPFTGICLTDTFEMYESEDLVAQLMEDNSERRSRQKALDIRVIIGNPPYNVADTGVNYESLNQRISETYAANTSSTNKNSLYDSYIKAIRWASDRVGDSGVIGFVTNAGWLDGSATDGMRKCLNEECCSIFVLNLRGNQRTSGDLSKREGGKIFGQGSRAPVAISILVKNPNATHRGKIYYHDIGDYLSTEQKLAKVSSFSSVAAMELAGDWNDVAPDAHNDWINIRNPHLDKHLVIGDKKSKDGSTIFENYTSGLKTQRDAWCYNASKTHLLSNVERTIDYYNQILDYRAEDELDNFYVDCDKDISWTTSLKTKFEKGTRISFSCNSARIALYRPFFKNWVYYNRDLVERFYRTYEAFPKPQSDNRVIMIRQRWSNTGQLALMTDCLMDIQAMDNGQCFPLYLYEESRTNNNDLFSQSSDSGTEFSLKDGLSNTAIDLFRSAYADAEISKEDLFYYVYGLLHSEEYREKFFGSVTKELPRIPAVTRKDDFWSFSKAGRRLADLHVEYENAEPYPVTFTAGDIDSESINDPVKFYRVERMKFAGKRGKPDRSTLIYNNNITIANIPEAAYEYVVNGKSALDWVIERQSVSTHGKSGIVNDANDYAIETMNDPAYPLKLFQRVITVSLETMEIVRSLPTLDID